MVSSESPSLQQKPTGTHDLTEDEAIILVKAAPRRSEAFGETVCCAGIDRNDRWVRLYPVSFRHLDDVAIWQMGHNQVSLVQTKG